MPMQVLSEINIVSLAHTVILNPMSSYSEAVVQMRGSRRNVFYVSRTNFVPGDTCGCNAADERDFGQLGSTGSFRKRLCANVTAFEEWILGVKQSERETIAKRHAIAKPKARDGGVSKRGGNRS